MSPMITDELDCSADSQFISASGGTLMSAIRDVGSKPDSDAGRCVPVASPLSTALANSGKRERVGQQADMRAAPHARQRKLRRQWPTGRSSHAMASGSSQRAVPPCVSVSISASSTSCSAWQRHQRGKPHGVQRLVLHREPAALGEIGWQHLALQDGARGKQRILQAWRTTMV